MGFIDETIKLLNIKEIKDTDSFCYLSFSHGIVIEGYKKIYEISKTKITVLLDNSKQLEIIGQNMIIKELSYKELSINGQITTLNLI